MMRRHIAKFMSAISSHPWLQKKKISRQAMETKNRENKCMLFLIFSQDNLGFAFTHFLPCKLKVPNDDCDCPLYFTLFVLPNIDWFPLSPECVTHTL